VSAKPAVIPPLRRRRLMQSQAQGGSAGTSAYAHAVACGFSGTVEEWLASLVGEAGQQGEPGPAGDDGAAGQSAYQLAVAGGFVGDQAAWLLSLKGDPGTPGSDGEDGEDGVGTPGADGEDGAPGPAGPNNVASARLTANRTTTSTSMANITDLAIAMGASETWSFECELHAGCNNTGGSQFSVSVPAGATVKVRAFGNTNSATAWTSGQIAASDGASPTMLNISAQGRRVCLRGLIINGATPGNIQARFKSVTNGQTTTVEANSYITARKH
jgi:hypothetical protein